MASKPIIIKTNNTAKLSVGKSVMRGIKLTKMETLRKTLKSEPENWGAWASLAELYAKDKNWKQAIFCYTKVLNGAPLNSGMKSHIGVIHARGFRMKKAYELVEEAIKEEPDNQHHKLDLCRLHRYMGEYEKALALYQSVRETIAPNIMAENNRSNEAYLHLSAKNYVTGLTFLKESWDRGTKSTALGWHKRKYKLPAWDGDDLTGRTIMLTCEQGLGDGIIMLRYLPMLLQMNPDKIYVAAAKPLHRLLNENPHIDAVMDRSELSPVADVEVCSFDLPLFFKTSADTVPPPATFNLPKSSVNRAAKMLAPHKHKLKVGVLWTGNPRFPENHLRSFPIQQFLRLSDIPNIQMFSLYKGDMPAVLATSPAKEQILDVSNSDKDLADSAAFMEQLDLVITIDSAVAHLSGSTNTPVWCLLKYLPFWYYADGKSTPWYPNMRLFTKENPGAWAPVFKRVRAELESFAAAHKP
jgi:tetratricopeptide (TPR) repeat protein